MCVLCSGDSSAVEVLSGPLTVLGRLWDSSHDALVSWFSFPPTLQWELLRSGVLKRRKHQVTILNAVTKEFPPGNHLTGSVLEYVNVLNKYMCSEMHPVFKIRPYCRSEVFTLRE